MSELTSVMPEEPKIVLPDKVELLIKAVRSNLDPYGAVVVGSAINVMAELAAVSSPQEAHDNGLAGSLTGFQAGAVALIVAQLAPRGEEFRQWWNPRVSPEHGKEANAKSGAVLNPALWVMKEPS